MSCIDGSYISIRNPAHKTKSTYVNRHDATSITLQGICDSKLRFLDVFTGVPSKIHDARVFRMSFISKDIENICQSKYHLLGDAAYPIRDYLITPFRDYGQLREAEKEFNIRFSQTRVKIENSFGLLKNRFRQLMRMEFHKVETMAKFVIACCTLHNFCIDNKDLWDKINDDDNVDVDNDVYNYSMDDTRSSLFRKLGEEKRDTIKKMQHFLGRNENAISFHGFQL